jgi:ABC-type dipeptide/oligopeptide/nickel transport system permease subunit
MGLLVVYLVIVVIGQAAAVLLGLQVDQYVNKGVGLVTFLTCFFAIMVISWPIAVRVSRPKAAA